VPPVDFKTVAWNNYRGKTVKLEQYTTASVHQDTTYTYDRLNRLIQATDSEGNHWTYTYDLAGRKLTADDPDTGLTTTAYDTAGRPKWTIDADNQKLSTSYDDLSRVISRWAGEVGTGTKLTEYVYDTLADGQLTSSTRYDNSNAYVNAVTSFDDRYRPTATTITIPSAEGDLAGTYTWTSTYNNAGQITTAGLPAAGDLGAETITYNYDSNGYPTTVTSSLGTTYQADVDYYDYGPVFQTLHGSNDKRIRLTTDIDQPTARLAVSYVDIEDQATPGTFNQAYTTTYGYDDAGNITAIAGTTATTADQVECFTYDQLRRLTEAWTETWTAPATWDCSTPQRAGADPYHRAWTFDDLGNRLTQTDYDPAGNTTWTSTITTSDGTSPHQTDSITATGPQAQTTLRAFTYNDLGQTTARTTATGDTQTLTWDPEGHLATITEGTDTTSYLYDADGNRLIARTPTQTTLYLPGTELTKPTTGSVSCTRYYDGATRTSTGLTWTINDHHGTGTIQINATTLTPQRARSLPYGQPRGTQPSTWIGTKGYVGGTKDNTSLTHLGAREYDPTTGQFISVDPIQDLTNPQQWNGYSYTAANPITSADPGGLYVETGGGGGGRCSQYMGTAGYDYCANAMWGAGQSDRVVVSQNGHYTLTMDSTGRYLNGVLVPPGGPTNEELVQRLDAYCGQFDYICDEASDCLYMAFATCVDHLDYANRHLLQAVIGTDYGADYFHKL
jgi:RHS repeat-associated protein